jgi:AraC-like DNA-binding protein/mannose-6-phosphate isomerase-like protein (cupin superfamily)
MFLDSDFKKKTFLQHGHIMKIDKEGIRTSIPNNEATAKKFTVNRKIRYIPVVEHRHDYIEIVYVLEGSYYQNINGKQIRMNKGDLCILDRNVIHGSSALSDSDVVVNFMLTTEFFDAIFMHLLSDDNYISNFIINSLYSTSKTQNYLKYQVNDRSFLKVILENLLFEYYSSDIRSWAAINGYLLILFTELSRAFTRCTGESIKDEQEMIKEKILKYIREHYKDTNLKELGEYFHFHPSYLSSLIKKEFGENLKDLLTEARMAASRNLLQNTDMTIQNIVIEVGYTNPSYFYKVFKKTYGMTPAEYKTTILKNKDKKAK